MNLFWILEGRLAVSGMIHDHAIGPILEMGIGAILSLTSRTPFPNGAPEGIACLHLPIPDMTAPPPDVIERAVGFLGEQISRGRPALVHCGFGLGRSGTVAACYLVSEGRDPEGAIFEVRAARPGAIETPAQEQCVRSYFAGRGEEAGDG